VRLNLEFKDFSTCHRLREFVYVSLTYDVPVQMLVAQEERHDVEEAVHEALVEI